MEDGWLGDVGLVGLVGHAALTEFVGAKGKDFVFGGQEEGELDATGDLGNVLASKVL